MLLECFSVLDLFKTRLEIEAGINGAAFIVTAQIYFFVRNDPPVPRSGFFKDYMLI